MNQDEKWMQRAIQLAKKGISGVSPNPLVGCVIVKNGRVLGEGYHAMFGEPHAEINAINRAGKNCVHATLYTNLEPCCHWGKTPPCTDAIIRSGIQKVVAAIPDPNPLVKGKGLKKLRKAGVAVKTGICKPEAENLNRFFIKFISKRKPYVFLKSAISLDGKIATVTGQSQWISSSLSRDFSYQLRAEVDAILVGDETVRKDNPSLTSHGKGRNPVRIVLTSNGQVPHNSKVFDGKSPTWIFHSTNYTPRKKSPSIEYIGCTPMKNGKISFSRIAEELACRGISKLLIEGGGETAAGALEACEVDELFFFIAPILIGGKDAKTAFEGCGFKRIEDALRLTKLVIKRIGPDILINARIAKQRDRNL